MNARWLRPFRHVTGRRSFRDACRRTVRIARFPVLLLIVPRQRGENLPISNSSLTPSEYVRPRDFGAILTTVEFFRFMILISIAVTGSLHAHLGHDNRVDVRVFKDRMRLVFRTSLPYAWSVLGDRAPVMADDAGKAVAAPLLAAVSPSLFTVMQGGEAMTPVKADGLFEPDDHVAFVLNFKRPDHWPVTVEANFFPPDEQLDATTIAVFDQTTSPFATDRVPVLNQAIEVRNPVVSFSLTEARSQSETPTVPVLVTEPERHPDVAQISDQGGSLWWLAGSAVAILMVLSARRWVMRKP